MMCEFLPEEITLVEGIICPGPFQHPGMTNGKARVTVLAWSLSDGNQLQQSLCLLGPVPHQTAQPSSAVRLWGWGWGEVMYSGPMKAAAPLGATCKLGRVPQDAVS